MTLLQMIIALALVVAGNVWNARTHALQAREQVYSAAGQIAALYDNALNAYASQFESNLIAGTPVTVGTYNVATPLSPTLQDLASTVTLAGGMQPGDPFWGGTWKTLISVTPAGCVRPNCTVTATLYATQPITTGASADVSAAGIFVAAAGGPFGYSGLHTPGTVFGANGQWNIPNPLGNVSGVVAAVSGGANALDAIYIRRDGAVTWTGDQNVNGVSLNNVQNLNLQDGGALNVASGAAVVTNDGANAVVGTTGLLEIQASDGTAADIGKVRNISASGTVAASIVNFNTTAATCTMNQVTMRGNNVMSVCSQDGTWVPIGQLVGNVMTVQKYLNFSDGMTVPKPICTNGTATASIIPQSNGINVAVDPPIESVYDSLVDVGSAWQVSIKMVNASGAVTSGTSQSLTAEVDAQCQYANE